MAKYKEVITQAQDDYIVEIRHKLVRALLNEGTPDMIVAKIMRISKQLVYHIKNKDKEKEKVDLLLESNKKENG